MPRAQERARMRGSSPRSVKPVTRPVGRRPTAGARPESRRRERRGPGAGGTGLRTRPVSLKARPMSRGLDWKRVPRAGGATSPSFRACASQPPLHQLPALRVVLPVLPKRPTPRPCRLPVPPNRQVRGRTLHAPCRRLPPGLVGIDMWRSGVHGIDRPSGTRRGMSLARADGCGRRRHSGQVWARGRVCKASTASRPRHGLPPWARARPRPGLGPPQFRAGSGDRTHAPPAPTAPLALTSPRSRGGRCGRRRSSSSR